MSRQEAAVCVRRPPIFGRTGQLRLPAVVRGRGRSILFHHHRFVQLFITKGETIYLFLHHLQNYLLLNQPSNINVGSFSSNHPTICCSSVIPNVLLS